jgi:hypothetical protein
MIIYQLLLRKSIPEVPHKTIKLQGEKQGEHVTETAIKDTEQLHRRHLHHTTNKAKSISQEVR